MLGDKPGKLERATTLLNKLEKGEIFLPKFNNQWLPELESEWLTWTGQEDETADQIDAAAYAARHARGVVGGSWAPIKTFGMARSGCSFRWN